MSKILTLSILYLLSVFSVFNSFFNEVSLTSVMPEQVQAGSEFTIDITVSKGDISGFARFMQDLPNGFTAREKVSANGEFRFEDQKVKFQWMRLPYDQEVVVSYIIQVAPTISGTFSIGGTFSYIANNQVTNIELVPKTITVNATDVAEGDINVGNTTGFKYGNITLRNVDCVRQKPYLNESNEVIVTMLVNKGNIDQFGKIQEQIPTGYIATSVKSKNAIFTYKNRIVKFLWMNLPPEPQFTVTYKLVPENEIPDQAFIITGTFSYAENERTKVIDVVERNVDLAEFDSDKLVADVGQPVTFDPDNVGNTQTDTEENPLVAEDDGITTQQDNSSFITYSGDLYGDTTKQVETESTDLIAQTDVQEDPVSTDNQETETQQEDPVQDTWIDYQSRDNNDAAVRDATLTNIPEPQAGVAFRVQIAAGHKLVDNQYFRRLNVKDHIQTEIHDGWHKYTVGSFPDYMKARNYRVYIWNSTPIKDAFVSAYNNGQRITVQEALMITNQKWYK
jgi:hypothetical protein